MPFNRELLLLALGFYTRLPIPPRQDYTRLAEASLYLPIVGWLVGGASASCVALANLFWPQTVAVILAIVCGIVLTGAFHEDGFADVCDGFGGGYGKEQILDIMKDSRVGTYGALGLVLLMMTKVVALSALPTTMTPLVMLTAHSVSRWLPLMLMRLHPYARTGASKSRTAIFQPDVKGLLQAGCVAALPLLLLPMESWLALIVLPVTAWLFGKYCVRHIEGYTGDCLGAVQQIGEVLFYVMACGLWKST